MAPAKGFTPDQVARYARHLILPEVGGAGQRKLLSGTNDIGRLKVESAAETLRNLNPDVEVVPINEHLNSETAMRIFAPYDVIVDGTDNFPTRYLANDAAYFLAKPLVHGSILRFEGRLAMFDAAKGTGCYRCLFPEPPPPD